MVVNLISRVGVEEDAMSDEFGAAASVQRSMLKVMCTIAILVVLATGSGIAATLIVFMGKSVGAIILAVTAWIVALLIAGGILVHGFFFLKMQKNLFS